MAVEMANIAFDTINMTDLHAFCTINK